MTNDTNPALEQPGAGRSNSSASISVGDINVAGNVEGNIIIGNNNQVYEVQVNVQHGDVFNLHVEPVIKRHRMNPQPPRAPRGFVGRDSELVLLENSVTAKDAAFIYGHDGLGKTALVRQVANSDPAKNMPDGVVFLESVDETGRILGFNDIVQLLFDAFYESNPPLKANLSNVKTHLSNTVPLVVLDGFDLPATAYDKLPDLFPHGALLVASRSLPTGDDLYQPYQLSPLTRGDSIQLLADKSGIPADATTLAVMDRICELCGDVPLAITKIANLIQRKGIDLSVILANLENIQPPSQDLVQASIERSIGVVYSLLSDSERAALGVVVDAPGISVDRSWLESITQDQFAIAELEALELIQANSPRMRIAEGLRQIVHSRPVDLQSHRNTLLAYLLVQLRSRSNDFDFIAGELGNLLGLVEWATYEKRWADVITLGRAVDPYLTLHGLWDAWENVLRRVLLAGQNLRDQAVQAWALHQLGSREIGVGSRGQAVSLLARALRIRETIGDRVGAAFTQHNLNIILPPKPPEPPDDPKSPPRGPTRLPTAWIISGALVILTIIAGIFIVGQIIDGRPTPTPTDCPMPQGWQVYTVQEGDTFDSISQRVASAVGDDVRAKGLPIVQLAMKTGNCIDVEKPEVEQPIYVPVEPVIITPTPIATSSSGEIVLGLSGRPGDAGVLNEVGQTINYVYDITNEGSRPLEGTPAVTDDKETAITCPEFTTIGNRDSLFDPQETIACTSTYQITQADLDNGLVTNATIANIGGIRSNEDSHTLEVEQNLRWELSKVASPTVYSQIDQEITYTYTVSNTGNVTLFPVQFTITDSHVGEGESFDCDPDNSELAPDATKTCTATYKITQADVDARSVTNEARASIYAFGYDLVDRQRPATMGDHTDTATVNYALPPTLEKTADREIYDQVDQVITYTYVIKNVNDVPLPGQVTVDDDKTTVSCQVTDTLTPPTPTFTPSPTPTLTPSPTPTATATSAGTVPSLMATATGTPPVPIASVTTTNTIGILDGYLGPNQTVFCTATYIISQEDLDFGSVTNRATAYVGGIPSNLATVTVKADQKPGLSLAKTAAPTTYNSVGQSITYTYVITNSGNVTLGPDQFTISDNQINNGSQFNCGPDATRLTPKETVTCNAVYSIVLADIDAGSITNNATASVVYKDETIRSLPASSTITFVCLPPPAGWVSYTVRAGDTLYGIASWYRQTGTSLADIQRVNCMGSSTVIYVGQKLYVPYLWSISGIVFLDPDNDGEKDDDENLVTGFPVTIRYPDGSVYTTTTKSDGKYVFSNLPPGVYSVLQASVDLSISRTEVKNFGLRPVP